MPPTRFVVTGFGKFAGVEDNPTTHLIGDLQEDAAAGRLPPGARVTECTVLCVAAADVDAWLQSQSLLLPGVRPAAAHQPQQQEAQRPQQEEMTVLLHLGVSHTAEAVKLEECAYNNASFRSPDERGWQPQGFELEPGEELDAPRSTRLPLGLLEARLQHAGFPVCISRDPGRFVCNYLYFRSLCVTRKMHHDDGPGPAPELHSLFVHVPPFDKVDRATQRACVVALVSAICECECDAAAAAADCVVAAPVSALA